MSSREVIKLLLADGWREVAHHTPGSHRQFRHEEKKGKVTVPEHGSRDIPIGTLKSIGKQSGLVLA